VEVNVRDLLERRLSIGKEEVDAIAAQPGTPESPRQSVRHSIHRYTKLLGKLIEKGSMKTGNDENMARSDGLMIHEGDHVLVPVYPTGRQVSADQLAQLALILATHGSSIGDRENSGNGFPDSV
jgi:hypothetical protein